MQRLEEVVDGLEQGELELDDALARFEEGVRLARQCAGALDAAERRIDVLIKEGDALIARPFDAASGEERDAEPGDEDEDEDWG